MKLLIYVLITLAAGVGIALIAKDDPGHVVLSIQNYTIETSVVVLLVVTTICFVILYVIFRLLGIARKAPKKISRWSKNRKHNKANQCMVRGMIALNSGQWESAEQLLLSHVNDCDKPALNYISAARAAQQQGAHERRDHYLKLAHQLDPSVDMTIGITQAELQLNQGQYEQALATLKRLHAEAPKNSLIIKLLARLYIELKDWERLVELLPLARKYQAMPTKESNQWQKEAYKQLLMSAGNTSDIKHLNSAWERIPKALKQDSDIAANYAQQLAHCGDIDNAVQLIDRQINHHGSNNQLVDLYGQLQGSEVLTQMVHAEKWLGDEHETPALFITLGRLAIANQMWAKARDYLQRGIKQGAGPQAYQLIARVYDELGEVEHANASYKLGLERATNNTSLPSTPTRLI